MRELNTILLEQMLNLDNTEKAVIASMAISPSEEMAYAVMNGARNSMAAMDTLRKMGYIRVNDEDKKAMLTDKGREVLVSNNLTDETGKLTELGQELVARFRVDRGEWKKFESFKYLL